MNPRGKMKVTNSETEGQRAHN